MMDSKDQVFYEGISKTFAGLALLAEDNLPYYENLTSDIVNERLTDIDTIEHNLDTMASFCFDERILLLYKRILRKLIYKHPETVKCYVDLYYMMYECDAEDEKYEDGDGE